MRDIQLEFCEKSMVSVIHKRLIKTNIFAEFNIHILKLTHTMFSLQVSLRTKYELRYSEYVCLLKTILKDDAGC